MKASVGQPYIIRLCRPEDLNEVLEIEREAFPDPFDRTTFIKLLAIEPGGFLVAEGDDGLLGYVVAVARGKDGMIYSIAVSQGNRRSGVGRRLMEAELDYLSTKVERVQLQVSVNNQAAISMYRTLAFGEIGRIGRYYSNGDDAILMCLVLPSGLFKRP